jgi:hypothetical protein
LCQHGEKAEYLLRAQDDISVLRAPDADSPFDHDMEPLEPVTG